MDTRHGDLEIEQDLKFEGYERSVQRIGWWALALFIVAASLGLFGGGPISRALAGERGSALWVEYERFVRVGASARLWIHVGSSVGEGRQREVRINRAYFDRIRIEHVWPQPERIALESDQVRLVFDVGNIRDDGSVVLDFQVLDVGRQHARIGTGQARDVAFSQFSYF